MGLTRWLIWQSRILRRNGHSCQETGARQFCSVNVFRGQADNIGAGIAYGIRGIRISTLINLWISVITFVIPFFAAFSGRIISGVISVLLKDVHSITSKLEGVIYQTIPNAGQVIIRAEPLFAKD